MSEIQPKEVFVYTDQFSKGETRKIYLLETDEPNIYEFIEAKRGFVELLVDNERREEEKVPSLWPTDMPVVRLISQEYMDLIVEEDENGEYYEVSEEEIYPDVDEDDNYEYIDTPESI